METQTIFTQVVRRKLLEILHKHITELISRGERVLLLEFTCCSLMESVLNEAHTAFDGPVSPAGREEAHQFVIDYINGKGERWAEDNGTGGDAFVRHLARVKHAPRDAEYKAYEHYLRMVWLVWLRDEVRRNVHELG